MASQSERNNGTTHKAMSTPSTHKPEFFGNALWPVLSEMFQRAGMSEQGSEDNAPRRRNRRLLPYLGLLAGAGLVGYVVARIRQVDNVAAGIHVLVAIAAMFLLCRIWQALRPVFRKLAVWLHLKPRKEPILLRSFPSELRCTVTFQGAPIAGLILWVELHKSDGHNHSCYFGPTEENGEAVIARPSIEAQVAAEAARSQDEYGGIFMAKVAVGVVSSGSLETWLGRYRRWRMATPQFTKMVRASKLVAEKYRPGLLTVETEVEPESIEVERTV